MRYQFDTAYQATALTWVALKCSCCLPKERDVINVDGNGDGEAVKVLVDMRKMSMNGDKSVDGRDRLPSIGVPRRVWYDGLNDDRRVGTVRLEE